MLVMVVTNKFVPIYRITHISTAGGPYLESLLIDYPIQGSGLIGHPPQAPLEIADSDFSIIRTTMPSQQIETPELPAAVAPDPAPAPDRLQVESVRLWLPLNFGPPRCSVNGRVKACHGAAEKCTSLAEMGSLSPKSTGGARAARTAFHRAKAVARVGGDHDGPAVAATATDQSDARKELRASLPLTGTQKRLSLG